VGFLSCNLQAKLIYAVVQYEINVPLISVLQIGCARANLVTLHAVLTSTL
jgi:hypothetical protein